jgi:hypothetical protein
MVLSWAFARMSQWIFLGIIVDYPNLTLFASFVATLNGLRGLKLGFIIAYSILEKGGYLPW